MLLRNGHVQRCCRQIILCLFYASSALLIHNGYEAHTHNGNLSLINLLFIKTQKLPTSFGKLLRDAFRLRQDSDYDDYFSIEAEDLKDLIEPAKYFIEEIKNLIL